jgi:hypothetical protein
LPSNVAPLLPAESKTKLLARARLLCLRELIAMEMPDHPDDIKWSDKWISGPMTVAMAKTYLNGVPKIIPTGLGLGGPISVQNKPTSRVLGLARKLSDSSTGRPIDGWQLTNANAELLYLIVEDSELDGSSAIELFGKSETADTDNDGLKEFIDAFGNPIQWIRWPTGYEGLARYHPDLLDPNIISGSGPTMRVTIESDPLDRMAVDPGYEGTPAYPPGPGAYPLVISGGLDAIFGLQMPYPNLPINPAPFFSVTDSQWVGTGYLNGVRFTDPWFPRNTPTGRLGGQIGPASVSRDNITNYDGNGASL